MKDDMRLANWLVGKIETEYKDDICVLLEHQTLKLDVDRQVHCPSFFIPATNRAMGIARTFIIDGVGYDIFPMSWTRMEQMADVKEYNTTCLADAKILYARSEEDRARFESLRERLTANLKNPHIMRERAQDWLNAAIEIYQENMLFEGDMGTLRNAAGHIADLLSIAVAFMNGRFFTHGQTDQIAELHKMERVPEGFIAFYEAIVRADDRTSLRRLCRDMIMLMKSFLRQDQVKTEEAEPDFSELALWYQELIYTWRRVYHFIDLGDAVNAHIWACGLQHEVDEIAARYGFADIDMLGAYNASALPSFRRKVEDVQRRFVEAIESNGVKIEAYASIDEFLSEN